MSVKASQASQRQTSFGPKIVSLSSRLQQNCQEIACYSSSHSGQSTAFCKLLHYTTPRQQKICPSNVQCVSSVECFHLPYSLITGNQCTPRTSSESCVVLLFSAGQEVTGHQTSVTMSFCHFGESCLLTMLYYTCFSNIHVMQTRPGGYKIPCKPFENSS